MKNKKIIIHPPFLSFPLLSYSQKKIVADITSFHFFHKVSSVLITQPNSTTYLMPKVPRYASCFYPPPIITFIYTYVVSKYFIGR